MQKLRAIKNCCNNYLDQFLVCLLALFLAGWTQFYLRAGVVYLAIGLAIDGAMLTAGEVAIGLFR